MARCLGLMDAVLHDAGMRMGADRPRRSQPGGARRRRVRAFATPAEHYQVLASLPKGTEEAVLRGTLLEWESIIPSVEALARDLRPAITRQCPRKPVPRSLPGCRYPPVCAR
ncbi:MAG: hypothetical protein R3F11_14935 [Verrucomicrobiales bacterium]